MQIEQARTLHRRGALAEAARLYQSILLSDPGNAPAAHELGILHMQRGQPERGEPLLRRAMELQPNNPATRFDHGVALRALGRPEEALAEFDRAIALAPASPSGHYGRGTILLLLNQPHAAIESFTAAVSLKPDFIGAYNERANALRAVNRIEEAVADYRQAIAVKPNNPAVVCNLGFALQDLGRFDEAMQAYSRAIMLAPDYYLAYKSRGTLELLQGRLREGFADYEWRLHSPDSMRHPAFQSIPYWSGEALQGKSILVYDEGAFGDIVQFCRYLPALLKEGVQVSLLVPARFHCVLAAERFGVRSVSTVEEAGGADFRCELISLPFLMKTEFETIPPPADHFAREPERITYWRQKLPKDAFNVGICWQGNPARHIDPGRSVPLAEFAPLAQIPGVRLISLQKHHGLDQLQTLPAGMQVETLDNFDDGPDAFVDTAAVMQCLDLVVSSDTAVAHLAAALGRPVWIALRHIPEWRWLLSRSGSPWYPSARLFRQSRPEDWASVFREMAAALCGIVPGA